MLADNMATHKRIRFVHSLVRDGGARVEARMGQERRVGKERRGGRKEGGTKAARKEEERAETVSAIREAARKEESPFIKNAGYVG